jgi:hypothetical protein
MDAAATASVTLAEARPWLCGVPLLGHKRLLAPLLGHKRLDFS